jgi:hypothetical protein
MREGKERERVMNQLSGIKTCLPECTSQGVAKLGELRIFLEYSFEEAMTIKL